MASRQNLSNRSNAYKPTGKSGMLSKVYGALGKQFKQQRAKPTVTEQPAGELSPHERQESAQRGQGQGITFGERDPSSRAPDFRRTMQQAEERRQRMTPPPAPTQPPISIDPGYQQRDEPVFDQSAIATEEQIPGQSTPLPTPSTATNPSNRLARNRVTARQPTEEIPPDSPRSRGMRGRR